MVNACYLSFGYALEKANSDEMEVHGNALLIGSYECPLCACFCVSMQQQWDLEKNFLPKLDALSKATLSNSDPMHESMNGKRRRVLQKLGKHIQLK